MAENREAASTPRAEPATDGSPDSASADAKTIPAWRLSGAGNDFVVLAEPDSTPDAATIRAWCRRGLSLGADGVFRLRRRLPAVEQPGRALVRHGVEVEMVHWNADGGRAELCVNGTRCAARLAFHLGWSEDVVTLLTDAGPVVARDAGGDRVALELAALSRTSGQATLRALTVEGRAWRGHHLVVGGPHFVLTWDGDLEEAPVASLGAALRRHPDLGEAGANVHFVQWGDGRDGGHGGGGNTEADGNAFALRSFERGVEAETLACGSGVLAAAAAGHAAGLLSVPATARTRGGFEMEVGPLADDDGWFLAADARLLARLEVFPGAVAGPPVATDGLS